MRGWTTTFAESVPGSRSFANATARSRYSTGSSDPTDVSPSTAQNASVRKSSSSESGSTPVTSAHGSVSGGRRGAPHRGPAVGEPVVPLGGAGVPRRARRRRGHRPLHQREERVAVTPAAGQHQRLERDAVERRVHRRHPADALRLERERSVVPRPGHDEDRRHVPELARDLLVEQGLVPRAMRAARSAPGGPHTIAVVGRAGAGDVDLVDARVARQVRAGLGAAVHDRERAARDRLGEGVLEERAERRRSPGSS